MRIALTIERLNPRRGGAEIATLRATEELVARGHNVDILTCECGAPLPAGATYVPLGRPFPVIGLRSWLFAARAARQLRAGQYDVSVACSRGYAEDIVWAHEGAHAAALAGKLRHVDGWARTVQQLDQSVSPKLRVYEHLERRRFARVPPPWIIAVSAMVAQDFEHHYGVPRSRIRVVHNQQLIDRQRFSPAAIAPLRPAARAALRLSGNNRAVLFLACNYRRKGLDPLLAAFARLNGDFILLVAGDKHDKSFRSLAARLGCADRVQFLPHQPAANLYAAADVFCLPTSNDPCALTTLEALACGLPVIGSRYDGAAELIRPGRNGFVLDDPHDVAALASAIRRVPLKPGILADMATEIAMSIGGVIEQLAQQPASRPSARLGVAPVFAPAGH